MSAPGGAVGAQQAGRRTVAVTGALGLVGRQVVRRLATGPDPPPVLALDLREPPEAERLPGVTHEIADVRDPELGKRFESHRVGAVVHLAAIVTPGPESSRELEHSVDVLGTQNVIDACVAAGVGQLVYTSSGAAYGYHPDNPVPLRESDPLRGNEEFAYAWHKRLAEQALERARQEHPELRQLVLRPGTILGEGVRSPISALFERPVVVGVRGARSDFVIVWDEDVADCIVHGLRTGAAGVYNLCGDGAVSLRQIARRLGKPYLPLPAWLLGGVLGALQRLRLSARGAEQVDFLRYRPVLDNRKLKEELGYTPRLGSDACFERYRISRFGPDPEGPLRDRAVAITGAASGIGAALARRAARSGARVALLDRNAEAAEAVAAALRHEGRTAHAFACDVTDPEACARVLEAAQAALGGRLDVLVANAGITHVGRVVETDVEVFRRVMEVNFFGAVHVARAALPELLRSRGQIVAIGSVAGQAPLATRAGYAASKHALHGFFRSLRAEHAEDGLNVLLVDPSFVETGIGTSALGPRGERAGSDARTGVDPDALSPEDAADAIVRAMERRRTHLFVPWRAGLYVALAHLAPGWFERGMARRMRGEAGK